MILAHFILALAAIFVAVFYKIELAQFYGDGVFFVQAVPWSVYACILVICCLLVLLTVILEQLKSYTIMYLLSRTMFELSLLGMSLLSFWSIFFGWYHLKNLWLDMIPLVFLPYLGIFVAMLMFQLFDFNYLYKKRVVLGFLLSGVTASLVFMHLI